MAKRTCRNCGVVMPDVLRGRPSPVCPSCHPIPPRSCACGNVYHSRRSTCERCYYLKNRDKRLAQIKAHQRKRKPATELHCAECGEAFIKPARLGWFRYCSTGCQRVAQNRSAKIRKAWTGRCERCDAEFVSYQSGRKQRFCSRSCALAAIPRGNREKKARFTTLNWRECKHCDAWFISRRGSLYCGDECRRVHNIDKALGAYRLATTPQGGLDIPGGTGYFRRVVSYLAHRDGERCAICHKHIDTTLPSGPRGNPLGPSIDHIIPRSEGGADTLANVRLTHWTCNRRRGNRGGDEQLRLIG